MPSFDFSYEYDGAGNRTKKIDNLTSEVTAYVYDSANQLISMEGPDGITTFDWDAAGNMIAKHAPEGTTTYTWDYRNRLTQIAPPVGDPINFAYNAMGQRIQKNGTRFIYDGVQLLQETDLNNQTLRSNTFTNEGYGDLVSENDGTDSSFPTFNGQSSTDAIVNKTATVTDRISYSAFGGQDSHTGSSTTPFRFVGKQSYYNDAETGLYLLGAGGNPNGAGRYYDPELGRFISRDPIGLAGGDVNLYRYAGNNPVNLIDPSGMIDVKKCPKYEPDDKACCRYSYSSADDTNSWIRERNCSEGKSAKECCLEGRTLRKWYLHESYRGSCDRIQSGPSVAVVSTTLTTNPTPSAIAGYVAVGGYAVWAAVTTELIMPGTIDIDIDIARRRRTKIGCSFEDCDVNAPCGESGTMKCGWTTWHGDEKMFCTCLGPSHFENLVPAGLRVLNGLKTLPFPTPSP